MNSLLPRRRSVFLDIFGHDFVWGGSKLTPFCSKKNVKKSNSNTIGWIILFGLADFINFVKYLVHTSFGKPIRKPCIFYPHGLPFFVFGQTHLRRLSPRDLIFFKDVMPGSNPKKPSNYCCLEYVSVGYIVCCKKIGCCVGNVALQQFTSLPGIIWFIDVWRAYQPSWALVSSSKSNTSLHHSHYISKHHPHAAVERFRDSQHTFQQVFAGIFGTVDWRSDPASLDRYFILCFYWYWNWYTTFNGWPSQTILV